MRFETDLFLRFETNQAMEQTGVNGGKKSGDKSRMKQLIKSKLFITKAKCCRHFVVYILPVKTFKGY
jgi:hypothetical protein